jgi:para-nitrobenzyl esterase
MSETSVQRDLLIETEFGTVQGVVADGVRTWRAIPYAAPPIGALRFQAPQPTTPWKGVRDAAEFGPIPMQRRGFEHVAGAGKTTPISENCLTINVSAPLSHQADPRPVVVWIYGGAFLFGGSRGPLYRGDMLVKSGNVIFVSFNYRTGAFGFSDFRRWSTPDNPIQCNNGLRDQVAALAWIQRNISAFGGDPKQVTIVGESAGATSVVSLMCIPAAAGLFHRAFAMSTAAGMAYGPKRHGDWALEMLQLLHLDPLDHKSVANALKTLPAEQVCKATSHFFYDIAPDKYPGLLPASAVVDGDFLPLSPIDAFRTGRAMKIPLVVGTMSREGALLDKVLPLIPSRVPRLEEIFSQSDRQLHSRISAAYPGYPSKRAAIDAGGDLTFWQPSLLIAESHSRDAPCWMYRFDYTTPLTRLVFGAATHGVDIPMLFGTTGEGFMGRLDLLRKAASKTVSQRFQKQFLDFACHGQPGWPKYDAVDRKTWIFDRVDRLDNDPRSDRRLAWGDFVLA